MLLKYFGCVLHHSGLLAAFKMIGIHKYPRSYNMTAINPRLSKVFRITYLPKEGRGGSPS